MSNLCTVLFLGCLIAFIIQIVSPGIITGVITKHKTALPIFFAFLSLLFFFLTGFLAQKTEVKGAGTSVSPSPTVTPTPSPTPTPTLTPSPTLTPVPTETPTPTIRKLRKPTPKPTATETPAP